MSIAMRPIKPRYVQSSLRKWGWPMLGVGFLLAVVGLIVMLANANSYSGGDGSILGILLVGLGCGLGNIGFFLLLFGILEDRIYEAQGMVQGLGKKLEEPEQRETVGAE